MIQDGPRYRVGQMVHCFSRENKLQMGFDFEGDIQSVNNTGDGIEYRVRNAPDIIPGIPLLIWEHEIVGLTRDKK